MNFDFSPEQQQFREHLRRLLKKADGLGQGRSILEKKCENYSSAIWQGLAEVGALAAAIPEMHAGLGLGTLELCVAAEEIGRVLAPVPFLSSIGVCAEAIRLFGSAQQQSNWLPGLAAGSTIGTWGFCEDNRTAVASETRLTAGRLFGTKVPVLDGMTAVVMLVIAKDEQGELVCALCDLAQPGVIREPAPTLDPTRPAALMRFEGALAEPLPHGGDAAWQQLRQRAAVFLAFEQLGSAEAALEMARSYALDRTAFGRKIGSFQAIKHKLADMYAKIELARCHCYYGAWAISTGAPETALAAAGARCSATDALDYAAQENIQIHGGIGVTWESDCQLFYRRARLNALMLGSRYEWQDHLIAALQRQ
jgi:alkylation response protein AidB-like acyl-CoA dehydrogenase